MSTATVTLPLAELTVLVGTPHLGGLCRDCRLAPTCTFPRDPERPVRSCEEFEPLQLRRTTPLPWHQGSAEGPHTETARIGLCRECARQSACTYPKPPGGVWHCDELA